jgi:hypothetical protein
VVAVFLFKIPVSARKKLPVHVEQIKIFLSFHFFIQSLIFSGIMKIKAQN